MKKILISYSWIVLIIFIFFLCKFFYIDGRDKGFKEGHYQGTIDRMRLIGKVPSRIKTKEKIVALTLDACAGKYDIKLIKYLVDNKVPATLFLTKIWMDKNNTFKNSYDGRQFDIQNHGMDHRPPFLDGGIIAGIRATRNREEMETEIMCGYFSNDMPEFYRSATGTYCKEAIDFIYGLGRIPVGGDVISGDWNPKATKEQLVDNVLSKVKPGSIIWMHMNKPKNYTAEALEVIVPELRKKGYRFVLLKNYIEDLY